MKKMICLLMAVMGLAACSNGPEEGPVNPSQGDPISLKVSMENFTRATDTAFEEGDQIGLYILTPELYLNNALFRYTEGALRSEKQHYWYADKSLEAQIVAYYPYTIDWSYGSGEAESFTVAADQSTAKNYTASDLMAAYAHSKPTNQAVELPFHHLLSKVVIKIDNQTGDEISRVTLCDVYRSVELRLNDPSSLLTTGSKGEIRAAATSEGYQLITVPQQGVTARLKITTASEQTYTFALESPTTLSSGKQATAHITLTPDTPTQGGELKLEWSIADWEEDRQVVFIEDEEVEFDPTAPQPGVSDGLSYIFDMEALPEIHLTVTEEQWNELLTLYDRDANTDEYIHCDASFTKEGTMHSFTDAGLRLRGNTSRRRPEGNGGEMHNTENPDYRHVHFMLNLRKFQKDDEHELGGVRKIHLKWHKDDPCYAREIFCYDLFRRYGIWTALNTSYCRLWLKVGNSKEAYYGVYIMLEAPDERYLKARPGFEGDKGFLWKCGWSNEGFGAGLDNTEDNRFWHDDNAGTTNRAYCLKTEIEQFDAAKAQIKDFIQKLNGKTGESFKSWINEVTDVEFLLKTYAVNVAVGMWDDYWCNQNNYYLYFNSTDKENYKFFFIPYDYDNTLGTSNIIDAGRQNPLQWGDSNRKLISKLLEFDEYRAIYLNALREICTEADLMEPSAAIARIRTWHQLIGEYVSNDTGEDMEIKDKPAGWSNHSEYRLLEDGNNNFFRAKAASIPAN